jgi:hypothetical protein
MEVQKKLTLEGNIVISVGLFGHSGDDEAWTEGTKEMLDDMHKRKIDMADEIYVINVDGYIGSSTQSEIEYAKSKGKLIRYYNNTIIFKTDLKEIPECCELCPYSKRYGLIGDRFCKVSGNYFTGNITPPYKERPDECPLIEITNITYNK